MNYKLSILIGVLLIFSLASVYATNVTNCTSITSAGNYNLQNDIINATTSSTYCINITSSNVIFECGGHTIDDTFGDYGKGIYINGVNNVSVSNCIFTDWYAGIWTTGNFSTITNITGSNVFQGVYLFPSFNSVVKNIDFRNHTDTALTIIGDNNVADNITSLSDTFGDGIYLYNAHNNTLTNLVSNYNWRYGIWLYANSSNNILINTTTKSEVSGLFIDANSNNNIIDNIISNNNSDSGVYINNISSNNVLTNITAQSNNWGIYIFQNSNNNTLTNANVSSNPTGMFLSSISNNLINLNMQGNAVDIQDTFTGINNLIYSNSFGNVKWSNSNLGLNGSLVLGNQIIISNNSIYFNSTGRSTLNTTANVTFYGLATNKANYTILKDGATCTTCYNFTALNAGTVVFNVTGWSNYTINYTSDTTPPILTIISPINTTYTSSLIWINFTSNEAGTSWFNNGTANVTYTTPVSLTLANANYAFIFYANDSSGNTNHTSISFIVNVPSSSTETDVHRYLNLLTGFIALLILGICIAGIYMALKTDVSINLIIQIAVIILLGIVLITYVISI